MIIREILVRFVIVSILSAFYGLQRQRRHKPIGFGTVIFVAVGACALSILASDFGIPNSIGLLSAIVTGIGFLGAGAIIKNSDRIFGFTTAASIWLFAIFGMAIGLGSYKEGFAIYAIVWLVVAFDRLLEKQGIGSYRKRVTITYTKFDKKEEISDILADYCTSFTLMYINLDKSHKTITSSYLIEGPKKEIEDLLKELYKNKWCVAVKFE
jgi:putative Mg2+ transporter-C (MgtC) family protein